MAIPSKKSSGPVANFSQNFKDQEEANPMKKDKELRASRKLVLAFLAIRHQEHPYIHKEPFLQMRGNGRSFMRIHQMEDILQLQYPRWLQTYCVVMTKMKDTLMVQDIGIQLGQYCRKHLHKKEHETLMTDIGRTKARAWNVVLRCSNRASICSLALFLLSQTRVIVMPCLSTSISL